MFRFPRSLGVTGNYRFHRKFTPLSQVKTATDDSGAQIKTLHQVDCSVRADESFLDSKFRCCLRNQWEADMDELEVQRDAVATEAERLKHELKEVQLEFQAYRDVHKMDNQQDKHLRLFRVVAVIICIVAIQRAVSDYYDKDTEYKVFLEKERLRLTEENQKTLMLQRLRLVYNQKLSAGANYVSRPHIETQIRGAVAVLGGQYHLFVGERGTGKSSSLCHVMHGTRGAVLVEVPEECSERAFVDLLCAKLGVDAHATALVEPRDQFEAVMGWFESVATSLRDEGIVVTLVVDDFNFLYKQASGLVPAMQHWFKRLSTKRIAACIGVVSEPSFVYRAVSVGGSTFPPIISDNRCELTYIGELEPQRAQELLRNQLRVAGQLSEAELKAIVTDGGVFAQHLVAISARIERGASPQQAVEELVLGEEARLLHALPLDPNFLIHVYPNYPSRNADGGNAVSSSINPSFTAAAAATQRQLLRRVALFRAIAQSPEKSVSRPRAIEALGSPTELEQVVGELLLAVNPKEDSVGFQSQLLLSLAKQLLLPASAYKDSDNAGGEAAERRRSRAKAFAIKTHLVAAQVELFDLQAEVATLQNQYLLQCPTGESEVSEALTKTCLDMRLRANETQVAIERTAVEVQRTRETYRGFEL
jgi:hypothetical protein